MFGHEDMNSHQYDISFTKMIDDLLAESDISISYETSNDSYLIKTPKTQASDNSLSFNIDKNLVTNKQIIYKPKEVHMLIKSYLNKDSNCIILNYKPYDLYLLIKGEITNHLKRKSGSLFIQEICKKDISLCSKILNEIFLDLPDLMIDSYGNYLIQLIYENLIFDYKIKLLSQIRNNIFKICNNSVGSLAIQHIIDNFSSVNERFILIDVFKKIEVLRSVASNYFGVQVIAKIISTFDENCINFIGDYVFMNFENLARTSTGLILIKNVIHYFKSRKSCKIIQNKIIWNFNYLIQDNIGNNIIQEVLKVINP
jgi:hypothetical protein